VGEQGLNLGVSGDGGGGGMRAINCAIVVEPGGAREGKMGGLFIGEDVLVSA